MQEAAEERRAIGPIMDGAIGELFHAAPDAVTLGVSSWLVEGATFWVTFPTAAPA